MLNKIYFPLKTILKMKNLGLSERQVLDVFHHGEEIKDLDESKMMVRKYSGYEIGLLYTRDKNTRQYVIISVWKRDRR